MIWYIVAVLHVVPTGAVAEIDYFKTASLADCEQQLASTGSVISYSMQDGVPIQIIAQCKPFSPAAAAKLPPDISYFIP